MTNSQIVIHKFSVPQLGIIHHRTKSVAPLAVGPQGYDIAAWFETQTEGDIGTLSLCSVFTGHMRPSKAWKYLGTVQIQSIVSHIYWVWENK